MLCADENFFPWIDICAIQINKINYYYYYYYFQTLKNVQLSDKQIFTVFIKEIMHCARNLQIIH